MINLLVSLIFKRSNQLRKSSTYGTRSSPSHKKLVETPKRQEKNAQNAPPPNAPV